MFETRITKLLGIKYPIIQGGMSWLSRAELAAAVSNAGSLGVITSANLTTKEELQDEFRKAKSLTDKPFVIARRLLRFARNDLHHDKARLYFNHYFAGTS
ncbi:NAD(P)H-dependent flavin oxidoreductase [Chloroflexota bacterium]